MDVDEMEAIMSVYCRAGECDINGSEVTINIQLEQHDDTCRASLQPARPVEVKLVLDVGRSYPHEIPKISLLSSTVRRDLLAVVKERALCHAMTLLDQPMILSLVAFIQEELNSIPETMDQGEVPSDGMAIPDHTALLHIDHMRSKVKYVRTLEKWASELRLAGRLMFYRRLILLLLQGCQGSIKDFIVRLKTTNVDVDSRGNACKERMMSVLSEQEIADPTKRFNDFTVCEFEDEASLGNLFINAGLKSLYVDCVKSMKGYL